MDLFDKSPEQSPAGKKPLADRMRPEDLDQFVGQDHLIGRGCLLREAIENDSLFSLILWGPPGTGKTTLARIMAQKTSSYFVSFSAVLSGIKEIKQVLEKARFQREIHGRKTILFIDEIHRFNKAQQDAFLPYVESGLIILVGTTTENPSFELNSALLSRTKVFKLNPLGLESLKTLLRRAIYDKEKGLGGLDIEITEEGLSMIATASHGDARVAYNNLESLVNACVPGPNGKRRLSLSYIREALKLRPLMYDKSGEEHYNLISAFHKSLRGGDPDAALYWLARMLEAGEDPLYIARRMVRFASEDVGMADPGALQVAQAAMEAFHFIGLPEGKLALAEAAVYLATAPKSNALYKAYQEIEEELNRSGALPVPLHLRNAPTRLMKDLGYGHGYLYPHDEPNGIVSQEYLPERLKGSRFYHPTDRGHEKVIKERLARWKELRKRKSPHENS